MTPDPPRVERSPFDDWTPAADPMPEPAREEGGQPTRRRVPAPARRILGAAGWLLLAVLIAFGGAGIVSAANRPPVAGARPELTWTTDQTLAPELAAATGDLGALSDDVDAFGEIGRDALTKLVDRDTAGLEKTIAAGEAQLALIAEATEKLRARLGAIPGIGPDDPTRIGTSLRVRYDRLTSALSATDGLADSWASLTGGSVAAIDLATSLAEHDTEAAAAAALGRKFQYRKALDALAKADAALARSRQLRDRLANTTDVDILSRWIDRNATFDAAVRKVWTMLVKSKGKINKEVRTAFDELRTAQAALPPDSRAMIIIMAEVARGGLNQAVIAIEEARGRLSAATDAIGG
ncbi:MAG TPA: hypothetical protein VLR93_06125 [Patescibacteria group bacterium]|nr:hypothetical protein [Patescibacteria group bacterium]